MAKELREKETKDLTKLLTEKREEVRAFRFGAAGSQLRDVKAARNAKHEIARILTELNARGKSAQ